MLVMLLKSVSDVLQVTANLLLRKLATKQPSNFLNSTAFLCLIFYHKLAFFINICYKGGEYGCFAVNMFFENFLKRRLK